LSVIISSRFEDGAGVGIVEEAQADARKGISGLDFIGLEVDTGVEGVVEEIEPSFLRLSSMAVCLIPWLLL